MSYGEEMMLYLSGPLANLAFSLFLLPFLAISEQFVKEFCIINTFTMLSNLLPVEGYDGYGALVMLFRSKGKEHLTRRLEILSFILSILVTFAALHLIEVFGEGYWIFGLFFFTVLSKLANFGKYDIFEQ